MNETTNDADVCCCWLSYEEHAHQGPDNHPWPIRIEMSGWKRVAVCLDCPVHGEHGTTPMTTPAPNPQPAQGDGVAGYLQCREATPHKAHEWKDVAGARWRCVGIISSNPAVRQARMVQGDGERRWRAETVPDEYSTQDCVWYSVATQLLDMPVWYFDNEEQAEQLADYLNALEDRNRELEAALDTARVSKGVEIVKRLTAEAEAARWRGLLDLVLDSIRGGAEFEALSTLKIEIPTKDGKYQRQYLLNWLADFEAMKESGR